MTDNEHIDEQMAKFKADADVIFEGRGEFETRIDERGHLEFTNPGTQLMFVGWTINYIARENEKKATRNPFGFHVDILVMGNIGQGPKPQLLLTAHPDLTREQWKALGAQLIEDAGTMSMVNVDELTGEDQ